MINLWSLTPVSIIKEICSCDGAVCICNMCVTVHKSYGSVWFQYSRGKKLKCLHFWMQNILIRIIWIPFYFAPSVCLSVWHIQWGKKVFSQPPIVQVLPLKKMREACNFHHRYTSTMRDKIIIKNPENHIVGFLKNLFANYGGK